MSINRLIATVAMIGTTGLLSSGVALDAHAQSQRTEQNVEPGLSSIEEIVITARKRQESLLEVPVIATVLSGQQLDNYAAIDLSNISQQVPGLLVGTAAGVNGGQISMRGVGPTAVNPGIDQSISLNIDGVQITQGNAYKVGMFDVAQIEVLKGPQALFFGKNSPAGVISLRTADPGEDVEIVGQLGYETEAEEKRGELVLSGPVSSTLGLRLSAMYSDTEGFFRNKAVAAGFGAVNPKHRKFAPKEDVIVRGTVLWEPSQIFDARLKLNYARTEIEGMGGSGQFISCPEGTTSPSGIPFMGGVDCTADDTIRLVDMSPQAFPFIQNDGVPFSDLEQYFGSLELNYQLQNGIYLTSISGFYNIEKSALLNSVGSAAGPVFAAQNDLEREDFTQELRLSSDFVDNSVNFIIGAFYQDAFLENQGETLISKAYLPGFPRDFLTDTDHEMDIRSISAFGQVSWNILPDLELSGGARWTDEEREHKQTDFTFGVTDNTPLGKPKISSDNISPEISLTYMPTEDLTIFASYKKGFKSGSFNISGRKVAGEDSSFGDEEVSGGEIGLKSRLFDRSLSFDLAFYQYDYEDLQVSALLFEESQGGFAVRTQNAAAAEVRGIELSMNYRPPQVEELNLYMAWNWNKAEYEKFLSAPCWGGQLISEGCDQAFNEATGTFQAQDLSGKSLIRAPDWTGNFGFTYEIPVGKDMAVSFGSNTFYSSEYYSNLLLTPGSEQDSYFKTSANISLRSLNHGWEISLIGNNLTNEFTCGDSINGNYQNGILFGGQGTGTATPGVAGIDELLCQVDRGREIWLRFTMAFFN